MSKLIHCIWIQGEAHLQQHKPHLWAYVQTWRQHFPGWTLTLWADPEIRALLQEVRPQLLHLYDVVTKHAIRSDIARYVIVLKYGGMYADTDMECLRSFEHLLLGHEPEVPKLLFDHTATHGPLAAIMMAVVNGWFYFPSPGHPALEDLLTHIETATRAVPASTLALPTSKWVFETTGPKAFERAAMANPPIHWLPSAILNPVDFRNLHLDAVGPTAALAAFPQAFAIHHPEGSWVGVSRNKRALMALTRAFSRFYEASPVVALVFVGVTAACVVVIIFLGVMLAQRRARSL